MAKIKFYKQGEEHIICEQDIIEVDPMKLKKADRFHLLLRVLRQYNQLEVKATDLGELLADFDKEEIIKAISYFMEERKSKARELRERFSHRATPNDNEEDWNGKEQDYHL